MRAVVYRLCQFEGHGSWRPRSLTDMRGARFPDAYHEWLVLDAESIDQVFEKYDSRLGDVIFLGDNEEEWLAYVAAPFGWEMVKFGKEWKSPE
jgi:hypothetical protein